MRVLNPQHISSVLKSLGYDKVRTTYNITLDEITISTQKGNDKRIFLTVPGDYFSTALQPYLDRKIVEAIFKSKGFIPE